MKLDLTVRHMEITDAIREFVERKVEKLAKFFEPETICHVTISTGAKGREIVDIRIEYKSHTYLAEEEVDDMYYGIESLILKIESQIRKDKDAFEKKRRERAHQEQVQEDIESILDEE